nr:MAG TPA_asm: hypothetical protein [Bacteriophage sp.]
MTAKDLLYACGNVNKKTLITVVQATGKELVSRKNEYFLMNHQKHK